MFAVLWCFQIPVVAIKSVRNIFEKMAADSADGGAPTAPPASSHQKKVIKSVAVTGYQSGGGHIAEPVVCVNATGVERTQAASLRETDYGWVFKYDFNCLISFVNIHYINNIDKIHLIKTQGLICKGVDFQMWRF